MARRRRYVLLLGLVASLLLTATVGWQVAWEAHYLRRLREDPQHCRALVAVSESSPAGRAMRRFLRHPDGMKALLDTLSMADTSAVGSAAYPEFLDERGVEERRRHIERWLRLVVRTEGTEGPESRPVGPCEDHGEASRVTNLDAEGE